MADEPQNVEIVNNDGDQIDRQRVVTGTLSSTGTVDIDCDGLATVRFLITGTFEGSLLFSASVDGSEFNFVVCRDENQLGAPGADTFFVDVLTALDGTYSINVAAFKTFRVEMGAYVSGSASVTLVGAPQASTLYGPINVRASDGGNIILGLAASATSVPVVIASDQIVPVAIQSAPTLNVSVVNSSGGSAVNVQDGGNILSVDDGGGVLSIDDGGGSLTVDGAVTVSGTVAISSIAASVAVNDGSGSLTVDDGNLSLTVDDGGTTLSIDDGGGSITVDATQSGTWNIATLTTITNVVHVDDNSGSLTVDNNGTFAVQASQNGAWNIGTLTTITNVVHIDDNSGSLTVDNNGTFAVQATISAALPAGTNAIGKLAANDGVDIGDVTVNNAAGASAVNIQDGGNSITVDSPGMPTALGAAATAASMPVNIASDQTVPVSAVTLPLPTNAASETNGNLALVADLLQLMLLELRATRLAMTALACDGGRNQPEDFDPTYTVLNNRNFN